MAYADVGSKFVFGPKYTDHPFAFKVRQIPWSHEDDDEDNDVDDDDDDIWTYSAGDAHISFLELCHLHPLLRRLHALVDM